MAARAIGSGTISFGLVSIPVKLYSTVDTTKEIHFNYLSKDGSRLKQQYVSASTGEVVDNKDRVLGYEFAKGQYVLFSDEERKAMNVESTNAIDIAEFIPLKAVERVFIEKVYYLGPDKGAARAYHLLRAALADTGRAALANYAARGKSYLVLIRPYREGDSEGLVMEQLKHEDELRPFSEVPIEPGRVNDDELELARTIIDQRTSEDFEPERYEDRVRSKMRELIEQKIEGQEITMPPEEAPETKIVDLMEALKASVSGSGARKPAAGSAKKRPAAKKAAGKSGAKSKKPAARAKKKPASRGSSRGTG